MKRKGHLMSRGAPVRKRPTPPAFNDLDARGRILEAARPLFAAYGFNGTSVRDITSAADVNVSAIGYYFTTKNLLYNEVLQSIIGPVGPLIVAIAKTRAPSLDRIERMVREFFRHIRANPDMPTYMLRELAEGPAPSQPVIQTMGRALPAMAGVIAAGQDDGTIRDGVPILLALSTVAQPIYLYLAKAAIAPAAGVDIDDDRVIEHAVAFVRAALEKR
jgi:TetR/AcrR family transcriptional regulator